MPSNPLNSKKKRLLTVAAIFLLPILIVCIALRSLLHSTKKEVTAPINHSAFNTELPAPNLPTKEKNKLELYMEAHQDSIYKSQENAKDPYPTTASSNPLMPPTPPSAGTSTVPTTPQTSTRPGIVTSPFPEDNDKKVNDRLQKIYAALQNPPGSDPTKTPFPHASGSQQPDPSAQIEKLEKLMQTLHKTDTSTNPQLNQVMTVLDRIKEIQHPESVSPTGTAAKNAAHPLSVDTRPADPIDPFTPVPETVTSNGFFGLSDDNDSVQTPSSTIQAVINTDEVVQSGSIVKLRLLQPIYVAGQKIPANSFIYGPAYLAGERVNIQLTNAIYDGHIYPISLKVYDGTDGLEGLYVPGMITRDVVKQNMSQGIGTLGVTSFDPSLGAQAAAASIETARNLLSRKVAIIKATLKAGHLAILRPAENH